MKAVSPCSGFGSEKKAELTFAGLMQQRCGV
jgi:hypothetical protein